MELLRGVSAANNFVLALVPLLSSRLLIIDHDPAAASSAMPRTTMMSWLTDRDLLVALLLPVSGVGAAARRRPTAGAVHGRRGRAPKTPTLLDVLWVWGRLKLQNQERSLPRVLDSNPTSSSVTDTRIVGGGIMSKRNLVIEEGSVEALARLQKQDEEFCRRLRAAIETGRECCPTTVFTEPCTNRPVSNYMRPDLIRGYRAC